MESKELQNKLKKVCIYIFSFFIWYLVVAFFLKSQYPIYNYTFNREGAYEVLRDGLTLSSYFLAPAVAFVLFNDWRLEHREKIQETYTSEIYLKLEAIQFKIREFSDKFMSSYDRDLDFYSKMEKEIVKIKDQQLDLLVLSKRSISANKKTTDFIKLGTNVIQKKIPRVISSIEFEVFIQKMREFPKEMGMEYHEKISEIELKKIRAYPLVLDDHIGEKLHEIDFALLDLKNLLTELVV